MIATPVGLSTSEPYKLHNKLVRIKPQDSSLPHNGLRLIMFVGIMALRGCVPTITKSMSFDSRDDGRREIGHGLARMTLAGSRRHSRRLSPSISQPSQCLSGPPPNLLMLVLATSFRPRRNPGRVRPGRLV